MRILADESCDRLVVISLRDAGHDVIEGRQGDPDLDVFRSARTQGRVLLTDDLDFGRLAEAASEHPPAILLTRLYPLGRAVRAQAVLSKLSALLAMRSWAILLS